MSILQRGRLISRFVAVIRRLDPQATSDVADGGYDDDFNEMVPVQDGTSLGSSTRREMDALRLRCQIRRYHGSFDQDGITRGGHEEETDLQIILFMKDLEDAGLVDSSNVPLIKVGDRIEAIEDLNGNPQWAWPWPPGLIVNSVEPRGYGAAIVGTPRFNLVTLHCHVPLMAEGA